MRIWKNGIMGVVIGDALGCPVQFESRGMVAQHPVTGMRGHGTFNLPAGSWTDDSSLTLALLESVRRKGAIDYTDIMENFVNWLDNGAFTPYGYAYDIGGATMSAIQRYKRDHNPMLCGCRHESDNGNGSLMRILPACIYCSLMRENGSFSDRDAIETVHAVGSLTHAHIRANIACGLYFFMVHQVLTGTGSLKDRLRKGLTEGFAFYESCLADKENLHYYDRLRDLTAFSELPADKISSSGYVVDTLEAAVWSLITTADFKDALLKAVNLGDDTDTVGAIAGGLGGLYYGMDGIPEDWLAAIKGREWIESLCDL
jgi:ADP-ribosylglycohydrolase